MHVFRYLSRTSLLPTLINKAPKTASSFLSRYSLLIRNLCSSYSHHPRKTETMADKDLRSELYPEVEPYEKGTLAVSKIHTLYYEQCGNKSGNPVVFLHGGPGGGTTPADRRFFDPDAYRIVLFHQRGSGQSTPSAELRENTTWHSVEDIEKLRKHLGIDKWVVFGGSWGSTLAMVYAQTHPGNVKALILRGIFTLRRSEVEWLYEGKGANMIYPDHWEPYINFLPEVERGSIMDAYYRRLTSDDEDVRIEAAKRWSTWEMATSSLIPNEEKIKRADNEVKWALQFARIECHYFVNGGFFSSPNQILDNVDKIRHIPASIVQGRYDVICPMETAWQLHKRWPEAEFVIAATSGHNSREPNTLENLVKFCEKYKNL